MNRDPLGEDRVRRRDKQPLAGPDRNPTGLQDRGALVLHGGGHQHRDSAPQRERQTKDASAAVPRREPTPRELHDRVSVEEGGHDLAHHVLLEILRVGQLRESDGKSHPFEVGGESARKYSRNDNMDISKSQDCPVAAAAAAVFAVLVTLHVDPHVRWWWWW